MTVSNNLFMIQFYFTFELGLATCMLIFAILPTTEP